MSPYKIYITAGLIYLVHLATSLILSYDVIPSYHDTAIKTVVKLLLVVVLAVAISRCILYVGLWQYNWVFLVLGLLLFYLAIMYKTTSTKEPGMYLDQYAHYFFLFWCVLTAVFEELLFRVFLFNGILRSFKYQKKKGALLGAMLWTSVLFGLAHISNFFESDHHPYSVTSKIIIAFGLGLLFQSVYVRFKNLSIIVMLHAIINYLGGFKGKVLAHVNDPKENIYTFSEFVETLTVALMFLIVLVAPIVYLTVRRELRSGMRTFK
ncbi:lysostaphin resistance A-like protein [Maribacter sp. 2307ULW6-5]|uniref:CPBP family intramembrane glutamic endopeptidase n=1 Tax=Maribacter sp. 2307ULW6-5 TaxID=3386275 RepID=UPI0039BD6B8E